MQNVEKIMQKQLEGNNLVFETNIDSGFIVGDEDLIISLLCNIIDNGRKACRGLEGKIILSGVCCNDEYIFSVEDNGCGMPADELEKIKEAFYMVDKQGQEKKVVPVLEWHFVTKLLVYIMRIGQLKVSFIKARRLQYLFL